MGFVLPLERVAVARRPRPRRSTVALRDTNEFAYLLTIAVGGQRLPVMLDTGSSDLWLVSTECASATCAAVQRYDGALSSSLATSSLPFELRYLAGAVRGTVAWETVVFGAFAVARQALALVHSTDALDLAGTGNSGILGLAFARKAAIAPAAGAPLIDTVFANLGERERFFGVRLGRGEANSSFAVGELDPAVAHRASEIAYSAVVPNARGDAYDYWKLPMRYLTVDLNPSPLLPASAPTGPRPPNANPKAVHFALSPSRLPTAPPHSAVAVFDTGTTLMLGPAADVARFWALVGSESTRYLPEEDLWEVRCNRRVGVSVALGDSDEGSVREYAVHPFDVSWAGERFAEDGGKGAAGEWCLGGIQPNNHVISGDWLLGDTFLRNVYLTHHAAGNATPPTLGLLGLTDPLAAAAEFRAQRGEDAYAPLHADFAQPSLPPAHGHARWPWLAVSLAAGTALGIAAVLAHAWCNRDGRLRRRRRNVKRYPALGPSG